MPVAPTQSRTLTPPKYAVALQDRTNRVVLEQRLAHFIDWLREEHNVELCLWTTGQMRRLDTREKVNLVEEYVNT